MYKEGALIIVRPLQGSTSTYIYFVGIPNPTDRILVGVNLEDYGVRPSHAL